MKRTSGILALIITILSFCFIVSAIEEQKADTRKVNILILNTGDIHEASGNLQKISEYISKERQQHPDEVILVDAGDILTQYPIANYEKPDDKAARDLAGKNEDMLRLLQDKFIDKKTGNTYDAIVCGNHDFIGGVGLLQTFPNLICSNLLYDNKPLGTPYRIVQRNGVTVGIIGIADQTQKDYHFPKDSKGKSPDKEKLTALRVNDKRVKDVIKEVERKSPDFIIILSHNKDSIDTEYVASLPINKPFVIIGGHSHNVLSKKVGDKFIIKSGKHGECVGSTLVTLDPITRKIINIKTENIPIE